MFCVLGGGKSDVFGAQKELYLVMKSVMYITAVLMNTVVVITRTYLGVVVELWVRILRSLERHGLFN